MRIDTNRNFERDLRDVRNAVLRRRVNIAIANIRAASAVHQIPSIRRVQDPTGLFYRVRVGGYRLGFELVGDVAVLDRFLIRKDFYRHFP